MDCEGKRAFGRPFPRNPSMKPKKHNVLASVLSVVFLLLCLFLYWEHFVFSPDQKQLIEDGKRVELMSVPHDESGSRRAGYRYVTVSVLDENWQRLSKEAALRRPTASQIGVHVAESPDLKVGAKGSLVLVEREVLAGNALFFKFEPRK